MLYIRIYIVVNSRRDLLEELPWYGKSNHNNQAGIST